MALCCRVYLPPSIRISSLKFSTSCLVYNKWRIQKGIEAEPRQFSPLTILPDYSFVDGRPAMLSKRKLAKLEYQKNLCKKIVELTNDVDQSLQLCKEKKEQDRIQKETILKNKLKPKGAMLLKKKNESSKRD